jgi:hypothetical protein
MVRLLLVLVSPSPSPSPSPFVSFIFILNDPDPKKMEVNPAGPNNSSTPLSIILDPNKPKNKPGQLKTLA